MDNKNVDEACSKCDARYGKLKEATDYFSLRQWKVCEVLVPYNRYNENYEVNMINMWARNESMQ